MEPSPSKAAYRFATAVIFLFPALILVFFPADGLGIGLLALAGLVVGWRKRGCSQFSREEKLLCFSVGVFFTAAVLTTLLGGIDGEGIKKLEKFAHLLLFIPAYIFLRWAGVNQKALWYGLVAGAAVAFVVAIFEVWDQPSHIRARGVTHPIIFGDLALLMGAMSLAGLGWFKSQGRWQIGLPIAAAVMGLLASFLAQARGGWVAVPFLTMILLWFARAHVPVWQRWAAIGLLSMLLIAAYLIPATGVKNTIDRTVTNISGYLHSDITDEVRTTSIGGRFEMWQAAWQIYVNNPVVGVGWGHYKEQAQTLVDAGVRNESAAYWGHPHNQFLSAMANGGTIALIALLLLFLIPATLFANLVNQDISPFVQRLALAGLLLIVAYAAFGLSEAIFERIRPVSFFAFYLAVISSAIYSRVTAIQQGAAERKQSLSAIIIAKDEADRIGSCLESVAGWADEIIVLDSGSTDGTVEIARRYTDKVFRTDWPGYGPQKQRALEKAGCDWVLSIDADEQVTPELRRDIDAALGEEPACIAYRLPWAVVIYGKRLDFGRSARAPLRLFRRKGARFSSDQVHETVMLPEGKIGKLQGRLLHFTHRDFGHALHKNAQYAWLGAQKRFDKGYRGGGLPGAFLRAVWTFILIYILRLGFLDGRVGFLMAALYSQNSFNKYAGLWTLRRQAALRKSDSGNR